MKRTYKVIFDLYGIIGIEHIVKATSPLGAVCNTCYELQISEGEMINTKIREVTA